MMKSCDACAKRVNEVRNLHGARICAKCASFLKEDFGAPETMRSPEPITLRGVAPQRGRKEQVFTVDDEESPDTELDWMNNPEACPGCGSTPGDGITFGCNDPMGCGHNRMNQDAAIGDAIAHTKRSEHMKNESAKFDGDAYMEETIRLEEARKRQNKAPVERESVGHIRQLRTQEHPNNRIKIRS